MSGDLATTWPKPSLRRASWNVMLQRMRMTSKPLQQAKAVCIPARPANASMNLSYTSR